jgi:hypothetical protein
MHAVFDHTRSLVVTAVLSTVAERGVTGAGALQALDPVLQILAPDHARSLGLGHLIGRGHPA